jgi:2-polyprenyl-3-methyl-5-hydroxy-6-metoxy-1,4-benzoquinol methylase
MENTTKNTVAIFDKMANVYSDKFMDTSLYHNSFDVFCNHIHTPNASILDVACGPGNISKYLLHKQPNFELLGIDLAPTMLQLAQRNNPNATFQLIDCKHIATLKTRYHGIMCGFALPYLSKEEAIQLIVDCSNLLLPNGVLYISTMEDHYSKSGFKKGSGGDDMYMYYHQHNYLTQALIDNNFKLVDTQRINYTMANGDTVKDLILIAQRV